MDDLAASMRNSGMSFEEVVAGLTERFYVVPIALQKRALRNPDIKSMMRTGATDALTPSATTPVAEPPPAPSLAPRSPDRVHPAWSEGCTRCMPLDYLSLGKDPYSPLASGTDYLSLTRDPSPTPEPEPESEDEGLGKSGSRSSTRGLYHSLSLPGTSKWLAAQWKPRDIWAAVTFLCSPWDQSCRNGRVVRPELVRSSGQLGRSRRGSSAHVIPWFAGQTGLALGSMAPTIAAGALGAAGGTAVGGPAGGVIGAGAGALSAGTLLSFGETYLPN